jgi:hypothetical protein
MSDRPAVDHAAGPDETTVWLFADSPDPLTVTIDSETWAEFEQRAAEDYGGDPNALLGDLAAALAAGEEPAASLLTGDQ